MMKIYDPPRKMPFRRLHKGIYKGCGDKNHNPRKGTEFDETIGDTILFHVQR